MNLSLDQLSDLVKLIALLAGGLWAIWTFHKLQRAREAEININVKVASLRKSQLEFESDKRKRLREQPVLAISLAVHEVIGTSGESGSILRVTVILKNEGDLNLDVTFDESALTVGRIVQDEHHRQSVRDVRRACRWWFPPDGNKAEALEDPQVFRIGQARTIPFAVHIATPGVYLVQFQATYQKRPFDDEKPLRHEPVAITAFEQAILIVTGKPGEESHSV
jgi:hypothetical protein